MHSINVLKNISIMPLFCSSRGKVVNREYCVHCGEVVEGAETIGRAKDEKPLSFAAFYKQKSNNRIMQYQKRKKIDEERKSWSLSMHHWY